ncbi:VOC family protein [Sulfobacillus harzensis]|uniref:VOC family protein n=1 Tax=Sulfobacillus harzensis TaxID=2729629 RepID=UPI003B82D5FD
MDGVLLARPFKVTQIGPLGLFVPDVAATAAFYQQLLGFRLTETVTWNGLECAFLRVNTEHHSLALFPLAARERLGLSTATTTAYLGLQVANYAQLRAARDFLRSHGCREVPWPDELSPGVDYAFQVMDPGGHLVRLYFQMDQIGWDGAPRPKRPGVPDEWPEVLDMDDPYLGPPFLGPLG